MTTPHDAFGLLAVLLAGACLCELVNRWGHSMTASKKSTPFNLGAAYAAKLATNDGQVEFTVGGADFAMPSAAKWTEDELRATYTASPFEVIRRALGEDDYARLVEAAKETPAGDFDFGMATELLEFYMRASGLGAPGE